MMQICDVQTQVFDDPRIFDAITDFSDRSEDRQKFVRMNLVRRHTYFVLQSSSGVGVAVLNTYLSTVLRDLHEGASVRYEAFVDGVRWSEKMQAWKSTGKAGILSVDINIYGRREDSKDAGQKLSKARLYLQHPHRGDDNAIYENPHFLSLPNVPDLRITTSVTSVQEVSDLPQYSVSSALEDLNQPGDLQQIEVDPLITTSLLR